MYDVSAQGLDKRMINVHYFFIILSFFMSRCMGTAMFGLG